MTSTTAKTYKVMLDSIRKGLSVEGIDFLTDFNKVSTWLETNPTKKTSKPLSASSLKTYYSMIVTTLRDLADKKYDEALKLYREKFNHYRSIQETKDNKQELTTTEEKKWLCWSCIVGIRDKILTDYNENNDWKSYQEYVIMALYTLQIPERLDYSPMRFVGSLPEDNKENYCVLLEDKAVFILNAYKTAWKMKDGVLVHNPMTWEAPADLFIILGKWRLLNKSEWLLVKKNNNILPMSSHELGQTIQRIFIRETNTPATLNTIRHSFITDKRQGEMPLLEKKRIADRMGHSLATAEKYLRLNTKITSSN